MDLAREDESCEAFIKESPSGSPTEKTSKSTRLRCILLLLLSLLAIVCAVMAISYFLIIRKANRNEKKRQFLDVEPFVDPKSEIFRLPNTLKPVHYNLTIRPNLINFQFDGTVEIHLISLTDTHTITVNYLNLHIEEVKLFEVAGRKQLPIRTVQLKPKLQIILIESEYLLMANSSKAYLVSISYKGIIYDGESFPFGLFFSGYGENPSKLIAVTQLAFNYARLVFPCFDEPSMKATFQLTLIRTSQYSTLSNTHLIESRFHSNKGDNITWFSDTFARTPLMSTYLLAFAVHQYQNFTRWTNRQIPITLWVADASHSGVKDAQPFLTRIADRIVAAVDFFEDYFNEPYSLRKLDFIYVPHMSQGAMENWGLVIIHEYLLRYTAIARHEVAHQWLGNIVTCQWWDDLWLHESLVTFLVAKVENLDGDFVKLPNMAEILRSEAIAPVPPIGAEVKIHSDLSFRQRYMKESLYEKGTFLINTVFELMGAKQFQQFLRSLVAEFRFRNLSRLQFYQLMEKHSKLPHSPKALLDPYLSQPGFPVIAVDRRGHITTLKLSWYSHSRGLIESCGKNFTFVIPIRLNSSSRLQKRIRLARNGTSRVTHDILVSDEWHWLQSNRTNILSASTEVILPNFHLSTYALVYFSSIRELSKMLSSATSASSAAATYTNYLSKSLFIVAEMGLIPYSSVLNESRSWSNQDVVNLELLRINYMLKHTKIHEIWLKKVLFNIELDDGFRMRKRLLTHHFAINRTLNIAKMTEISTLICLEGYKPCYQEEVENLRTYLDHSNESHIFLSSIQVCTAVRYADRRLTYRLYQHLFFNNQYNTSDYASRNSQLQMLCTEDKALLFRLYARLSKQHGAGDFFLENKVLSTLIRSSVGMEFLWNKLHRDSTVEEKNERSRVLAWLLVRLGDWQDLKLAELTSWLTIDKVLTLRRNLEVEQTNHETLLKLDVLQHMVNYRSQWLAKHYANFENYFRSFK